MSLKLLILIAGLAFVVVWYLWYLRRDKSKERSAATWSQTELPQQLVTGAKTNHVGDTFWEEIDSAKREADAQMKEVSHAYQEQLEARFLEDLQLKDRLSRFAREHGLDQALISLWEEVEYYPVRSKREDFEKWNKLNLTDIEASETSESKSVSFSHSTQRYTLSKKTWHAMESSYADFSLQEDGEEVFGISSSVEYGEWGMIIYRCLDITAFKKRGHWAKLLLEMHRRIQIERNKSSAEFKYSRADEIKTRFEE